VIEQIKSLGCQIRALGYDRDELVVRREAIAGEWFERWETHLVLLASARRLIAQATALRRDATTMRGDSVPLLVAAAARRLDGHAGRGEPRYQEPSIGTSIAFGRARRAA
jgi:hypothetical protein